MNPLISPVLDDDGGVQFTQEKTKGMRDAPSLDVADEMGNHETKAATNDGSPRCAFVHKCFNLENQSLVSFH